MKISLCPAVFFQFRFKRKPSGNMLRFLTLALFLALTEGFVASYPATHTKIHMSRITVSMAGGKGFGGGEATRDPLPTEYDPNDPKGKQQAIHKAESFAEYLAKRSASSTDSVVPTQAVAPAPSPVAAPPQPVAVAPVAATPAPRAHLSLIHI